MKYTSTRDTHLSLLGHEAIIQGLSKDGGLFIPSKIDFQINPEDLLDDSYQEIAETILSSFFDDYSKEEIKQCVQNAYDTKFDDPAIVPYCTIDDHYIMELWHGPTSAFKDLALTILPHLLTCAYQKDARNDTVAILTATSGDTGKAALSGFADVPNTDITVFYPSVGVSTIQKQQMITSVGDNVHVIAVNGNFDDCQRMVKQATSNEAVLNACQNVTISSANSINIGRLIPQVVYYYATYINLVKDQKIPCGEAVNFVVPTGNFGDILAGYFAKLIGLPIHRLICASNSNNILTDFINTGVYDTNRPFHTTISPSMDILISSNLERLLFLLSGRDDTYIASIMDELKETGRYTVRNDILEALQENFVGYWSNEEDCKKTITDLYKEKNVLIDPHTAVAYDAFLQYQKDTNDTHPSIILSTASPYKFAEDVLACISDQKVDDGFEALDALHQETGIPVPTNLANLKDAPIRFTTTIEKEEGMDVIARHMEELSNVQN